MREILRKELTRVFGDKKMIFSTFILPVLIMFVIMSIVSSLAKNMANDIDSHTSKVFLVHGPNSYKSYLESKDYFIETTDIESGEEMEAAKKKILSGDVDLIIEFPEDFDQQIESYQKGDEIPQIKTYYNPSEDYSSAAFEKLSNEGLAEYRTMLLGNRIDDVASLTVFTVNSDNEEMVIQDEQKASGKAVGMMLPYFVTILLFAGAMSLGIDMVAGEKERGTMASLLVAPIKRKSIALGKIFSLMIISGVSSLVYVFAMIVLSPMMFGGMRGGSSTEMQFMLLPSQIIMLLLLLIAIAFLYSSIIVLISVFARSIKEASSYIMPAYMIVLIVGLMSMFTTGTPGNKSYFIPVYNNTLAIQGILTQEISPLQYGVTLGGTLILGGVCIGLIVKAFQSEKIMST